MKRGICFLLTLCLILGVMSASLAESQLQGKPWVNPEMPGNLPAQCPAAEENFYLHVNYELHQQYPTEKNIADNTMTDSQKELDEVLWTLVNTGESTEARTLRILSSLIMDGKRREKEGMEPLRRYVRRIQETRNLDEFSALCREEGFVFGTPFGIFNLEQAEQHPERFAITIYLSEPVPMIISDEDDPDASYEPQLDTAKVEEELMQLGYTAPNARQLAERMVQYQNMEPIYEESDLETLTTKIALTSADIQKLCVPLYDQMVSQGMILEGEANTAIYQTIDVPAFRSLQNL